MSEQKGELRGGQRIEDGEVYGDSREPSAQPNDGRDQTRDRLARVAARWLEMRRNFAALAQSDPAINEAREKRMRELGEELLAAARAHVVASREAPERLPKRLFEWWVQFEDTAQRLLSAGDYEAADDMLTLVDGLRQHDREEEALEPSSGVAHIGAWRKYPYPEGETTVLGPEIFAAADESVICWRGVNYVPQTSEDERPNSENHPADRSGRDQSQQ